jgi:hypothetical protein
MKTTYSLSMENSYNWEQDQWTVPVNMVVSQLFKMGSQPAQVFVGGRYSAEGSTVGPDWGIRTGLTLLLPR